MDKVYSVRVYVYTSCNVFKSKADWGLKMRRRGQNREGETHSSGEGRENHEEESERG